MQERITDELAQTIHRSIQPTNTIVVIEAEHTCMSTRGVLKAEAKTITSTVIGVFKTDTVARSEALSLIRSKL
jgi:GTP cyclohydrolase I